MLTKYGSSIPCAITQVEQQKQTFMSKFKVGDTVRRIEDGSTGNAVTKGNLYEVKEASGSSVTVIDDTGKLDRFCIKKFELVSKELTSLPPKWCIKNNKSISEDLGKWFLPNLGRIPDDPLRNSYWHYPQISPRISSASTPFEGYTEITFDQFKKWVLGQGAEGVLGEKSKVKISGYDGLNIGDKVKDSDITAWCTAGENRSDDIRDWFRYTSGFHGDREIIKFKDAHGAMAFIVSGTSPDVYLRAEGFKDFVAKRNTVAPTPDKGHKTESLLEEAKRRYPVGTNYHIAHLSADGETTAIVRNPNAFFLHDGNVYESHGNYGANGHSYSEILYHRNNEKWAEIISKPNEVPEYVEVISDGPSYTTHSDHTQIGVPNYNIGVCPKVGHIYKVVKDEVRYTFSKSYVLQDADGKGYLIGQHGCKPSTREAYDAQFKKQEDFGTLSNGFLSPDVGPVWNKGLRDFPSSWYGQEFLKEVEKISPYYGSVIVKKRGVGQSWYEQQMKELQKEFLSPAQPSSKVSVNTHEEFKITINKPKTIKI